MKRCLQMIDFSQVITAEDKAANHRAALLSLNDQQLDRNMQALEQMALSRAGVGDTTTITYFRNALDDMHELTPPQV